MRMLHLSGFAALAIAILVVLPGTPGRAADERMPVPTDAEVAAKLAVVKDTYKADYAKTKVADRAALGQKLLQLARDTKDDPIGKYVLLLEARDLGAKGADGLTAMAAADELAADYRVPPGQVRAAVAEMLSNTANTPQSSLAAAQVLLTAAGHARRADDWDSTIILLKAAGVSARKASATKLSDLVAARQKEAETLKADAEKVKIHLETLKTKPDDPEANLAVGKYEFAGKEEFETGAKYLAKGSDPRLKDAALKDIKAAGGGEAEQLAAADAWYDIAASADPLSKPAYQLRAHYWYVEVLPDTSGLNKDKAEKRAAELLPVVEGRTDRNSVFVTIRKMVAEKQYKKWPHHGGGEVEFEEIPAEGAYLIGFDCTTISRGAYPNIIQPIWMTARGTIKGRVYGMPRKGDKTEAPVSTRAKPGYAVGALHLRTGLGMDQIKPIYMRVTDKGVDINDKYDGPQIGGLGGGPNTLGGDGTFIIGIHGRVDRTTGKIEGMSVVTMGDPNAKRPRPKKP
ncbi:MAG TPA: hypothetical protein VKE74_32530 [Gemmataceae bacterium]|nr:hypothetical protein [Gemmataceae bacterium]